MNSQNPSVVLGAGPDSERCGGERVTQKAYSRVADYAMGRYEPTSVRIPEANQTSDLSEVHFSDAGTVETAAAEIAERFLPNEKLNPRPDLAAAITVCGDRVKLIMTTQEEGQICLDALEGEANKSMLDWSGLIRFQAQVRLGSPIELTFTDLGREDSFPENLLGAVKERLLSCVDDIVEQNIY
jgi:hypothetical protein